MWNIHSTIHGFRTFSDLVKFIEGGTVVHVMEALGGNELKSAIKCMNNMGEYKNPREAITIAIGHLNTAYDSFATAVTKAIVLRPDKAQTYEYNARVTVCLMAICHKYLGNSDKIIKETMRMAYQIDEFSENTANTEFKEFISDMKLIGHIFNPLTWINGFGYEPLNEDEMEEIERKILSL